MNNLRYNEIKEQIENLPATWIPALIIVMTETAVRKNVLEPGKLACLVAEIEAATRAAIDLTVPPPNTGS